MERRAYLASAYIIVLLGDLLIAYCLHRAHVSPEVLFAVMGFITLALVALVHYLAPEAE